MPKRIWAVVLNGAKLPNLYLLNLLNQSAKIHLRSSRSDKWLRCWVSHALRVVWQIYNGRLAINKGMASYFQWL